MAQSIVELVDELPTDNLTVKVLNALDFVVPGEWENIVGFDNMIESVTGVTNRRKIRKISNRAIELYEDKSNGYQTAIWIYQTLDNTDKAIGAAALADKIGDTFRFIPFLDKLTPKADTLQSLDLKIKLVGELIAFSKLYGLTINPQEFATRLFEAYRHESLMRMATIVCIDGILPLGPDFISKVTESSEDEERAVLPNNAALEALGDMIPAEDKGNFLTETFKSVEGWMQNLMESQGLNSSVISDHLGGFVEIADDKLDYVAAFLDASTNYYEHTGIQTVARKLINTAYEEWQAEINNDDDDEDE